MHKVFQFLSVFCITTLIALGFTIHSYAQYKIPDDTCPNGMACEPKYVKCSTTGGDSEISGRTEDSTCPTNNALCTNWCEEIIKEGKENIGVNYNANGECRCWFDDGLDEAAKYIDSRIHIWFDDIQDLLLKSYRLSTNENILNILCRSYRRFAEDNELECSTYDECEGYDDAARCDENGIIQCNEGFLLSSNEKEQGCTACPNGATCDGTKNITGCEQNFYKTSNTSCKQCPSHASCDGGTATFKCYKNYYKNGNKCESCPTLENIQTADGSNAKTGTLTSGATSKSQCFLIPDSDSQKFTDEKGTFYLSAYCPIDNFK